MYRKEAGSIAEEIYLPECCLIQRMRKKRASIFILSAIACLVFAGTACFAVTKTSSADGSFVQGNEEKEEEPEKETEPEGSYICLTVTHDATPEGSEEPVFVSEVYLYGLKEDKVWKQDEITYCSYYPQTVYEKDTGNIFYTQAATKEKPKGLMEYSCEAKEERLLTSEVGNINYIIPFDQERLFLAGTTKEAHAIQPFFLDRKSGQAEKPDWKKDLFLWAASYVPEKKCVYVSAYSEKERQKVIRRQEKAGKVAIRAWDYYIFRINKDGKRKKILAEKRKYIQTIAANSTEILYRAVDRLFLTKKKDIHVYRYNIRTKKKTEIPAKENLCNGDFVYLAGNLLYHITKKDTEEGAIYQFNEYNLKKGTDRVIFETTTKQAINNAQFIQYGNR